MRFGGREVERLEESERMRGGRDEGEKKKKKRVVVVCTVQFKKHGLRFLL